MSRSFCLFGTILFAVSSLGGCAESESQTAAAPGNEGSGVQNEAEPIDGVALLDAEAAARTAGTPLSGSEDVATAKQALPNLIGNWVTWADDPSDIVTTTDGKDGVCMALVRDHLAIDNTDGTPGELIYQPGRLVKGRCYIEWIGRIYYYVMPNNYAKYLVNSGDYYFWWEATDDDDGYPSDVLIVDYDHHNTSLNIGVCESYRVDKNHWYAGKFVNGRCYYDWGQMPPGQAKPSQNYPYTAVLHYKLRPKP